ncbi:hypothetical protein OSC52_03680 [Clostridium pasteurianum]|uniref:hypothetical protein n=1 Tax=Clostridium pasteurianum TaxID=1501 RepID=UPI002260D8F9|nr:hypothetical protein [Clostridium pasteurianum]UZW14955.1 hypothetical protein OSC52_03680 [Clostridium pasteurianum]
MNNNIDKKYTYLVYGLIVQSDIQLPELMEYDKPKEQSEDIRIIRKNMPKHIQEALRDGKVDCFKKDQIWFSIENVAAYYIKDVNCIEFQPFPEADNQKIKSFLLGSAFGMLLIMRKSIALHGGSVVIDGKGIILTGDSGAGKSTLTAAFREKGYDFLADDVSVIGEDENSNLTIMPGYPQQKLCSDAVEKFKYGTNSIKKIDEDREKYAIAIEDEFRKTDAELKAIYELSVGEVETVQIRKITGTDKLNTIFNNIYRFGLINYIGIDPIYFKKCVQLAKNIDMYKIIRPKKGYSIDQQIEIIETIL